MDKGCAMKKLSTKRLNQLRKDEPFLAAIVEELLRTTTVDDVNVRLKARRMLEDAFERFESDDPPAYAQAS